MQGGGECRELSGCLAAVQRLIEALGNRGVVIGGVAVTFLARPRTTLDVDVMFLVELSELPQMIAVAAQNGLVPRIANADQFAQRSRVLLLRHEPTGVDVDIALGLLPFEVEVVERSTRYVGDGFAVPIPTPEDLIILKAIAHRPIDLADIRAVIDANPDLDRSRIEQRVKAFAEALDMPELWDDIAPYVSGGR